MKRALLPLLGLILAGSAMAQVPPTPPNTTNAQTAPTSSSAKPASTTAKTTAFTTDPITLQGFPIIAAKVPELAGDPRLKGIDLNKVIMQGRAAASESTDRGQTVAVDWYGVTTTDGTKAAHLVEPLKGNFLSKQQTIPAGAKLPAKGNIDNLVTAIKSLYEVKTETQPQQQQQKKSDAQAAPSASGSASGNDVAAAYKPQAAVASNEKAETPTAHGVTTEGCSPRVDLTQGVVIQQSAVTETKDGITTKGACSDSEVRWPIKTTSAECSDEVDLAALKAYPQEKPYYINDGGETKYLGTCARIKDTEYPLTADASFCPVATDINAMKATEATELVYLNANNKRVVADTCSSSRAGAKTWPITITASGCSRRDDFTGHKSYDQQKAIYVKDGVTVQVSDCTDSATSYEHVMDATACTASNDLQAKTATQLGKWKITTTSGPVYLSECIPTGTSGALAATIEGCESIHTDYLNVGYSRGAERYYHMLAGTRTYATECQESTTQYTHDLVGEGWVNDDTKKTAKEKFAVYIDLPAPAGRTLVSPAAVRSQSTEMDYSYIETTDVGNGTYETEGCMQKQKTDNIAKYTRPDGSAYDYINGPGLPLPSNDICETTQESRSITTCMAIAYGRWGGSGQTNYYSRNIKKNIANGYSATSPWAQTGSANFWSVPYPNPITSSFPPLLSGNRDYGFNCSCPTLAAGDNCRSWVNNQDPWAMFCQVTNGTSQNICESGTF